MRCSRRARRWSSYCWPVSRTRWGPLRSEPPASSRPSSSARRARPAIAGVLSGRVNPSGRLPVSVPAHPGVQPSTYLAAPLAERSGVSNVDPTPAYPFGHGLGYSPFVWERDREPAAEWPTDGDVEFSIRVVNAGDRAGADVDAALPARPGGDRGAGRCAGSSASRGSSWSRGRARRFASVCPRTLASFTGIDGHRIVEPGDVELLIARSSADVAWSHRIRMTGPSPRRGPHPRAATSKCGSTSAQAQRCCPAPRGGWRGPFGAWGGSGRPSAGGVAAPPSAPISAAAGARWSAAGLTQLASGMSS